MKTDSLSIISAVLIAVAVTPLEARTYYYDELGRLIQVSYSGGQGIRYEYDDADNLTLEQPITIPKAPTELNVVRTSLTSARLQWQDEDASETGFSVQRRLARDNAWENLTTIDPNTTSHVDNDLSPDENYVYRVIALGVNGNSAYSNASTAAGVESVPFEITSFEWVSTERIKVSFAAEEAVTYKVETSSTLRAESWSLYPFAVNAGGEATMTSVLGTSPTTTVYFDLPTNVDRAFYQVTRQDN